MAAAWKSAGASALLDAILYDDASFPSHRPDDDDATPGAAPAPKVTMVRKQFPDHPSSAGIPD